MPQIPDQPRAYAVTVDQLKEMISFLEEITGEPFDYGRLAEVLRLSTKLGTLNEGSRHSAMKPRLWLFDACFHMAPIVTMQVYKAVNYYRALKEEVDERDK